MKNNQLILVKPKIRKTISDAIGRNEGISYRIVYESDDPITETDIEMISNMMGDEKNNIIL